MEGEFSVSHEVEWSLLLHELYASARMFDRAGGFGPTAVASRHVGNGKSLQLNERKATH